MEEFTKNTIDAKDFLVEDVIGDGACMFRALANCIYYSISLDSSELENLPIEKKKNKIYKAIGKDTIVGRYNNDKRFDSEWGWNGNSQTIIARKLQKIAVKYIEQNKDNPLENDDSKLTLKDIVEAVHEMSYDEYSYYYSFFAGDVIEDDNTDETDGDETDEGETDDNDNSNDSDSDSDSDSSEMIDRWGGFPEQYAISKVLDRPIYVYSPEKWNKRTKRINAGPIKNDKFIKNVRLRLYDLVNKESNGLPLYILWSKTKKHYYALMPKI